MRRLAIFCVLLTACVGFVGSAVDNLAAWLHIAVHFHLRLFGIAVVVFLAVWLPGYRDQSRVGRGTSWSIEMRGCPAWARRALVGVLIYFAFDFVCYLVLQSGFPRHKEPPYLKQMGESAMFLLFNAVAIATYWSRLNAGPNTIRCPNGHWIQVGGEPCAKCRVETREPLDPTGVG